MARALLLVLTAVGVLAALPIGFARHTMEQTSNEVEIIFNYRDLATIAAYQAEPQTFIREQLAAMKEAGITTMAVFESTLEDLAWGGRATLYNSAQEAMLRGKPAPVNENYTYLLFADDGVRDVYAPIVERTFEKAGIPVTDWSFDGRPGLKLATPVENAVVRQMPPDPMAMEAIRAQGLRLLPRLSDRMLPYDPEQAEALVQQFASLGVTRILFDGTQVTGFADQEDVGSLDHFAGLLNEYGIGIAAIENLKVQQKGMNRLAYLTDYNVVRLYSLSAADAAAMTPGAIIDRFVLAAKDRNIRLFYLNGAPVRSIDKGGIVDPLDNLYQAIGGTEDEPGGVVAELAEYGFRPGEAVPFDYKYTGWQKALRALVALGAVAVIALLVDAFVRGSIIPVFALGLIGSAGLYVLRPALLEQALALGASIAAPTLALIWALGRIRARTEGDFGADGAPAQPARTDKLFGGRWVFDRLPAGKRLGSAIGLYVMTAVISLFGAAFVFGLLNNITYSLVLQQFRGVSLLHLAPIALTALYVFVYTGSSVRDQLRKLMSLQITVLWVAVAAVLGAAGLYYLSRTGNAGQASSIELLFRNTLESTFGVRPRTKEFLLAHPLFLLGLFLALRYRAAWVLLIVASIGQLSMVDTFAHIHTPVMLSLIRVLLGLGLGAIIGLVLIGAWQIAEGVWRAWAPKLRAKRSA